MISDAERRELLKELLDDIRDIIDEGSPQATIAGCIMGLAVYAARTAGLPMAEFAASLDELWHSKQWDTIAEAKGYAARIN